MGTIQINEKKVVRELDLVNGDITLKLNWSSNEEMNGQFIKTVPDEEPQDLGGVNFNDHRTIFWKPVGELDLTDEDLLACVDLVRKAFTLTTV